MILKSLIAGITALALAGAAAAQTQSSTIPTGHTSSGDSATGHRVSGAKARGTASHAQPRTPRGKAMPNGHASTRGGVPKQTGARGGTTSPGDATDAGGSVGGSAPDGAGTAGQQTSSRGTGG